MTWGLLEGIKLVFTCPSSHGGISLSIRPERGQNAESAVQVTWQDGRVTDSRVKWYGRGSRSEYRLTRFGRGFPFIAYDCLGDLLVLIPQSLDQFLAYDIDREDDIREIQAALGGEVLQGAAVYDEAADVEIESESDCIERRFREFSKTLEDFPGTRQFSAEAWETMHACMSQFAEAIADDKLMDAMDAEYRLFKMAERYLCGPLIQSRLFRSVNEFLRVAQSILPRRRSRAGWSLENYGEQLLSEGGIPFEMRPNGDGEPDVLIPGRAAYEDPSYPPEKLVVLAIKTTCKDRWRQVLREATNREIPNRHLLTIQQGISHSQLSEMAQADVQLVVPERLHCLYPASGRGQLAKVEDFVRAVQEIVK